MSSLRQGLEVTTAHILRLFRQPGNPSTRKGRPSARSENSKASARPRTSGAIVETRGLRSRNEVDFSTLFVLCAAGAGGQSPAWPPPDSAVGDTVFADCARVRAHHVVSPLSLSQNSVWRAYVDVDGGGPECLLKSSLWIARADSPYQLAYFIAPARDAGGNGMQILGWMPGISVVLVKAERWQWGSDGGRPTGAGD